MCTKRIYTVVNYECNEGASKSAVVAKRSLWISGTGISSVQTPEIIPIAKAVLKHC